MKLKKMKVRNFRGIKDLEFEFQNYSLLIGPNNSGKSTVLDAIRAFYGAGVKFDESKDLPKFYNKDDPKESSVELSFELNEDEIPSLEPQYIYSNEESKKELKLKKYFIKIESAEPKEVYYFDKDTNKFEIFMSANTRNKYIGNLIYIPAISNVEDQTKLTGPSPLRDSIQNIVKLVIEECEEYEKLKEGVENFSKEIKKSRTLDSFSLDTLQKELNDEIEDWNSLFQLDFCVPSSDEMVKNFLKWKIFDKSYEDAIDIKNCGSGFQRYLIYKLISVAGKYIACGKQKSKKEQIPQLNLILFEEPEAFLHPPQQIELARNLYDLSNNEDNKLDYQVICTSHSPHFIRRNTENLLSLIKMNRENGFIAKYQLNNEILQDILSTNRIFRKCVCEKNDPKNGNKMLEDKIDFSLEIEEIKYFIWLNPNRVSAFFCNRVLITEGLTEEILTNKLIDDKKIRPENNDYIVIETNGKELIPNFMTLFENLGIYHCVLYDNDEDKSNNDYHEYINKTIESIGLKNKYSLGTKNLKNDLEKFLKIQYNEKDNKILKDSSEKKPRLILYKYNNNQIDQIRLNDFCSIVTDLLNKEPRDKN